MVFGRKSAFLYFAWLPETEFNKKLILILAELTPKIYN